MSKITESSLLTSTRPLRRIGHGFCGSVWANPDDEAGSVVKREDGGPGRSLANDYEMHLRMLRLHSRAQINVPCQPVFVDPSHPFWDDALANFPPGYTACNGLISERIPAMPRASRNLLISKYCAALLRDQISQDENNEDCIIRLYLGRRRRAGVSASRFTAFTHRNHPLNADQMEEMNLDLPRYARAMADSLALMHWTVGIDANDVEFVLAPKRSTTFGEDCTLGGATCTQGELEEHALWILDLDCCRSISMDKEGMDRAVPAFYRNDPFYPRPGKGDADVETWEAFREQYLKRSQTLLRDRKTDIRDLPDYFVEQLILKVDDFKAGRHA
ncbi:zinc finger protein-domain-containing protein [Plectosphaerella plurivora]|uniref:Zinc finger protein-domain-containing protein n=1 Tax=Plectosphaerella plurivora TaxID=936078 RepID=A0A9P9AE33_9PEZI|nr:zinc finger protein-domain-containing protein [Plectosphaerella plurivora]